MNAISGFITTAVTAIAAFGGFSFPQISLPDISLPNISFQSFLTTGSFTGSTAEVGSSVPEIHAVVYEDLNNLDADTTAVLVKFYSDNAPVSDFLAVPIENIGHDNDGNYGVTIYPIDSVDPAYIAHIYENPTNSSEAVSQDKIEKVTKAGAGDLCFTADSNQNRVTIIQCNPENVLYIATDASWDGPYDESDNLIAFSDPNYNIPVSTSQSSDGNYIEMTPQAHTAFNIEVNEDPAIEFGPFVDNSAQQSQN